MKAIQELFYEGKYIPTIGIRPSEMAALEQLHGLTKDNMTPLILLAPWLSSKTLDKAMKRVEKAYPNRKFILDLDRYYKVQPPDSESNTEKKDWLSLFEPDKGFANWQKFWQKYESVIPCIQLHGHEYINVDEKIILEQIKTIRLTEKNFCFRVEVDKLPHSIDIITDNLGSFGAADFLIILEGGHTNDPLSLYGNIYNLIRNRFRKISSNIPFVVSCTSFPTEFGNIKGIEKVEFNNLRLIQQLRRQLNDKTILFGDWGSTRPHKYGIFGTPLPRIDFPLGDSWMISRNKEENWDYQKAAMNIVQDSRWSGKLEIWGERLIESTASNNKGIDSPQKNVAARVNIHLHRQALRNHNQPIEEIDLDEEWQD